MAYVPPPPRSWLDCAADAIEAGDDIGRLLFRSFHAAGIPFPTAAETTACRSIKIRPNRRAVLAYRSGHSRGRRAALATATGSPLPFYTFNGPARDALPFERGWFTGWRRVVGYEWPRRLYPET